MKIKLLMTYIFSIKHLLFERCANTTVVRHIIPNNRKSKKYPKNENMIKFLKIIALFTFIISFFSCSSIYYVGETIEPINVYTIIDTNSTISSTIPVGSLVLTQKKSKKYHFVIYETYKGYVYNPNYKNYHKYNSSIDGILFGYSSKKPSNLWRYNSSSSGGSVSVKGYFKKNGTYVSPHTRSSPGRGRKR